ncbi:MAG TPA: XdhC family protein [Thermoanaerobaculia bacterium]|nr:XdhC family protein [Thermoanaerobaculia bacterium]
MAAENDEQGVSRLATLGAATGADVLGEAALSLQAHGRIALCQIVRTEGSTPGKVGWKLVARPDGTFYGNLGGGAFEAMVRADAQLLLAGERRGPRAAAGSSRQGTSALRSSRRPTSGQEMRSDRGDRAGRGSSRLPAGEVKRYYLTEQAVRGEPTGMVCGGMVEVFIEVITVAPVLVICGGGPVGQALAEAAGLAGFEALLADDREAFRRPELFPEGTRLAAVDRDYGQDFLAPVSRRDLFVAVVSRCWETDVSALAAVLRQAPPHLCYLGLMGSRRKVARVCEELARRGFELSGVPLRAPIGLPIGGDSPGEIAISILAEVIETRHEPYLSVQSTQSSSSVSQPSRMA